MKPSDVLFNESITNRDKFGVYVRGRREELDMTLRDFANSMNLTGAYISDIENGNRYAPLKYLNQVATILQIEDEEMNAFYDIAGCTHSNWPDINEYLASMPNARKAIRLAKSQNMSGEEFLAIVESLAREREQDDFVQ